MGAPTGLSTVGARSKSLSDDVYGRSSARTLAKGVAAKSNRRMPACHDTGHLPILSVSRHENRLFGPETLRDTYEAAPPSVPRQAGTILPPRHQHSASHRHCQKDGHRRDSHQRDSHQRDGHQRDGHQARGTFTAGKTATSKMTIERITLEMKTIECGYGHQR